MVIEGPAFSTKAESRLYRSWGADLVSMTMLPEAKLAREAGICYAALACVTDYDVWREADAEVTGADDPGQPRADRGERASGGRPHDREHSHLSVACRCAFALGDAMVTSIPLVPTATLEKLGPIISDYVAGAEAVDGSE